jgi:glutamate/tyrosine decarboxylase-like PLP-dependent enzyme
MIEPAVSEPASPLFPAEDVRKRWDDILTLELAAASARVAEGGVAPTFDVIRFRAELDAFDFCLPRSATDFLPWTIAQMEHGLVHVNHPRYFGLFNPAPTAPSQWADRIAATFNPQLATWTTSPAAVEIEAHVIRAVARRAHLPSETCGHFTSGGAEANYTALLCALTQANVAFADAGARTFRGQPVIYASEDCHLAWFKIAHQAGIGRSAVRLVDTDGSGCMDCEALAELVASDRAAGRIPIMIVGTAGTTNAGMIDPLRVCARLAREADVWFHVDAAWGGALIASEKLGARLSGIEQANSVTIDAHKWFATTMGCGMFLTTQRSLLSSVFEVSATYMPSNDRGLDPYVTSLHWSRQFRGLRLFLSLAAAGWTGYADHLERAIGLAELLRQQLLRRGWRVINDSSLAVLCIEPPVGFGEVRSIVCKLVASGRAWVSVARFEGRDVIRACITHGETTARDIEELVSALWSNGRNGPDTQSNHGVP